MTIGKLQGRGRQPGLKLLESDATTVGDVYYSYHHHANGGRWMEPKMVKKQLARENKIRLRGLDTEKQKYRKYF